MAFDGQRQNPEQCIAATKQGGIVIGYSFMGAMEPGAAGMLSAARGSTSAVSGGTAARTALGVLWHHRALPQRQAALPQ